ncbi:MAG: LysE family transporter [Alphaproteobacteria bacterium]|nr:LysE family transporter [Alphaproteobacteria bacterium]
MDFALPLAGIWLANLMGAMSPGPSFFLVARASAEHSRRVGLASALGMSIGAGAWAAAAMFGLAVLFAQIAWLYRIVQLVGGLYLVYLAVMIWRAAPRPLALDGAVIDRRPGDAFLTALVVQLSNPKVVVFFGSIFVALLPAHAPSWVWAVALAGVLCNEMAWYSIVATLFSAEPARRAYGRAKAWLDRAMAGFLALIGAKLLLDSR